MAVVKLKWWMLVLGVIGALLYSFVRVGHEHNDASFRAEWEKQGDLDEEPEHLLMAAENGLPSAKLYPPVPLARLARQNDWPRPRCLAIGKVILIKREDDGDYHFVIEDGGVKVVCEIVPELPLDPHPKVGQTVYVWGIPRWDGQHRWGEIHPVIGWKEK